MPRALDYVGPRCSRCGSPSPDDARCPYRTQPWHTKGDPVMPMIRVDARCHRCGDPLHRLASSTQEASLVARCGLCDDCYLDEQNARDLYEEGGEG